MAILNYLFRKASQKKCFPPPVSDVPPVPSGEWSLVVDENADLVLNRAPVATDFLARPAITYKDAGTEPVFKSNPALGAFENARSLLEYEMRRKRNAELLKKAVFLLSQSDDGRRLLKKANDLKFTLVFDSNTCMEENAVGLCDYANKKIPLAEGHDPVDVALTLKHELQHMEDISNGVTYGLADTPRTAILVGRMLEANARVSESVLAAELLLGSPSGPARQFRTAALLNAFCGENPAMGQALLTKLDNAAAGNWKDFCVAILPAYFSQEKTLKYYDERYARFLEEKMSDISDSLAYICNPRHAGKAEGRDHHDFITFVRGNVNMAFSRKDVVPEHMAALLQIKGDAYGSEIPVFSGNMASAIAAESLPLLRQVGANMCVAVANNGKDAMLDLPLYNKPAEPPHVENPYAQYTSGLEEGLSPIRMPDRMDGRLLTNGLRRNESATGYFGRLVSETKSGRTQTDALNYAFEAYFYKADTISDKRRMVSDMVEAGFLAPIAAFPATYLDDLQNRLVMVGRGQTNGYLDLSVQEIRLFEHWRQMVHAGLDPVWIDTDNKKQSFVARDPEMAACTDRIAVFMAQESCSDAKNARKGWKASMRAVLSG